MKVSIITCTYNSAKTVGDALDSLVSQNYDDIEKNMNSNKQIVKKKKKTVTPKPYYKRNNYKGLIYSNLQNQVRKSENQQISIKTSKQSESLSCIPNNCFKKSSKIEVRFD